MGVGLISIVMIGVQKYPRTSKFGTARHVLSAPDQPTCPTPRSLNEKSERTRARARARYEFRPRTLPEKEPQDPLFVVGS